jgi:hypothetical protein
MSWIATGASGGAICWTPAVLALDIGYFLISLFDIYSEKVQPSMFRPGQLVASNVSLQAIVPGSYSQRHVILP